MTLSSPTSVPNWPQLLARHFWLHAPEACNRFLNPPMDPLHNYRTDPAAYARDVLGVQWWQKQAEIAALLLQPPYRVLVKAAHSVGKTYLAAGLVSWFFRCFAPSAVIT